MANCVLCRRSNPPKLQRGLCSTCYREYRAMMSLEEEPYRLAKRGDPKSLELLGFLQFLKRRETDAYAPIWQLYASIRLLTYEGKLPALASREEWLAWKAESAPTARNARAVRHYLIYKGFDLDRRLYRQIWFEEFMADETPPQVAGVAERLRPLLRAHLMDLRTKEDNHDSTLDLHGRNLIAFFEWLGQNGLERDVDAVLPEHVSAHLATFKSDGMTQGRKVVPGHSKTPWTLAKRVSVLRSFFDWAVRRRLCRASPVHGWRIDRRRRTDPLPEEEVAHLIGIWTDPQTHPRAAMVGLMILVYGLFPRQLLALDRATVDLGKNQFHGLRVPVPIPPVLRPVLDRYLAWREDRVDPVQDQSLVISWKKGKYGRATPAILVTDLRPYGVSPRQLRVTALAETIKHGSLKLLNVFGLTADGMKRYRDLARLAGHTRKVTPKPNLW
jgi:site-specific recombinase XerC